MRTESFKIIGMSCDGCTSNVRRALSATPGVLDVKVSLSDGEATVQYDEALSSPAQLKSAVTRAGYGVGVTGDAEGQTLKSGCCCG